MEISKAWRNGALITVIAGLSILLFMGLKTYQGAPPMPGKVVEENGSVLLTREDILAGQAVFQKYGLMDYGTFFGHGAYRGPDFTADFLHESALFQHAAESRRLFNKEYEALTEEEKASAHEAVARDAKRNRYDPSTDTLVLGAAQAAAIPVLQARYDALFREGSAREPLPKGYIRDGKEIRDLTAFFFWGAWASSAERPGKDYSYTNNWPPEVSVGNRPTKAVFLWSALSLIALLGGLALILMFFGRFNFLGWGGGESEVRKAIPLREFKITPSQKAVYPYYLVVAALFALQTLMGVITAHYVVEPAGFYGIDIRSWLPFTLTRTWHLQLAIFWVATAWLAAGLFLAPWVGEKEPKHQALWVRILFGAVVVVALGSLAGQYFGIKGQLGDLWFWLGHQGWEYLELGRLWQILLTVGMVLWVFLVLRCVWGRLKGQEWGSLPYLLVVAVIGIPLMFSFGMMYHPRTSFVVADFWRWWVVHLWVEGFFELFTTVAVAYFFVVLGLVTPRTAVRVIYLDILLFLGSGIVGTGHHYYWTAQPAINLALGATFSALEVVPLVLLSLEAYDFAILRKGGGGGIERDGLFAHYWAVMFLMAVGFWNFMGAGVFGFLINLPIVSYYEHATYLTSNHGHAALMGVYGNLALASLLFVLRFLVKPEYWPNRLIQVAFWSIQLGLGAMLMLSIFPIGVLQMAESYQHGYFAARSVEFWARPVIQVFTWLRIPGDLIFTLGGTLPLLYFTAVSMFHLRKPGE